MDTIEFNGATIRKWKIGSSTFLAWPEKGARLMNWHIEMADGTVRDVIHWPESADYSKPAKIRGGNPILFPFSARTFDQGEIGYWKNPEGKRLPMQMHGYTRDGDFELTSFNDKGFLATFIPSAAFEEAYPYKCRFSVSYRFEELALYVDLELANQDTQPIPWSAGHHFYFALPWHPGSTRSDYRAVIPAKKALRHLDDGSLEPVKEFSEETSFDEPGLVDRIHCKLKEHTVRFGPKSGEEDIFIRVGSADKLTPWNSVVTWTENEDSPFYCVEPWMGPPNSPEHKNGLHFVEPGKSEIFSVEISLAE